MNTKHGVIPPDEVLHLHPIDDAMLDLGDIAIWCPQKLASGNIITISFVSLHTNVHNSLTYQRKRSPI